MTVCLTCRAETPDGARFCPACGTRLDGETPSLTERKVVTTVFADLVGFTALGERADPEDVDAALRAYFELARSVIERFGGVVEKFIGDAVVGLFGVPAAHEDDAERAVRAALEIVGRMHELPPVVDEELQVRAAVNTGPALVRLDVLPRSGEGMLVGDAVNTAARLLTAAPAMAVVAGTATHRLTERAIAYERLPAISAKGKARPVERWVARGAIARRGIETDLRNGVPMVGREVELGTLAGLLDKAVASEVPQFALVCGEAGIGKSRLVREFFRLVDAREGFLCTWRQGRCPPYGHGLAYRPLREIASAHAGVLPGDPPEVVEQKLARAVGAGGQDEWILSRLRPLLGLPAPKTDRDENFVAWTRFLEHVATPRPTVLVIEDLHWASEPTLAFLSHFIRSASGVPLVLVGTARPEFLEAHPEIEEAGRRLTRLDLKALSPQETARLAVGLAASADAPQVSGKAAEGCGGNPLFAEELVRYLAERSAPAGEPGGVEAESAPDTVRTLIAARLDALRASQKRVMTDAAVVGQVFWPGALRAVGADPDAPIDAILRHLEEREFVRRSGESTIAGEQAFTFWHALVREVAYEALPRAARAGKHKATAEWLSRSAGESGRDASDLLAHHYSTALELAQATGDEPLVRDLREPTREALARAGAYAFTLDLEAAERLYARALELSAGDEHRRAELLVGWAEALAQRGLFREAKAAFAEGVADLRRLGDLLGAAGALAQLSRLLEWMGDDQAEAMAREAVGLVDGFPPSPEVVDVLERWVMTATLSGDPRGAISTAERVLALCRELGLPDSAQALHYRGVARCETGDASGVEDIRLAIETAHAQGEDAKLRAAHFNLAEAVCLIDGPQAALASIDEGLQLASLRGDRGMAAVLGAGRVQHLYLAGEWETALLEIDAVVSVLEDAGAGVDLQGVRILHALLLACRGRHEEAETALERADAGGRHATVSAGALYLVSCARVHEVLADRAGALQLLRACERVTRDCRTTYGLVVSLPEAVRLALALGDADLAVALAEGPSTRAFDQQVAGYLRALLLEGAGEQTKAGDAYAATAAGWLDLGVPYEMAHARLGQGRCLLAGRQPAQASEPLAEAETLFAGLGALEGLAETRRLLAGLPRA